MEVEISNSSQKPLYAEVTFRVDGEEVVVESFHHIVFETLLKGLTGLATQYGWYTCSRCGEQVEFDEECRCVFCGEGYSDLARLGEIANDAVAEGRGQ